MGDPAKVEAPILNLDTIDEEDVQNTCDVTDEDIKSLTEEEFAEYVKGQEQKIIEKAKIKSKNIIEEGMRKIEEERDIVLEQARKNGFEEGYDQSLKYCEDIIHEAGLLKQQAMEDCEAFFKEVEDEVVSIIMDISRKLIGSEINLKPEHIINIVKDALKSCLHKEDILLKVSENDYEYVVKSKNKLLAMVQGIGNIEIKMDHSLEQGSCLLETPYGNIDAGINTRLSEIEKVFKGLVGKE